VGLILIKAMAIISHLTCRNENLTSLSSTNLFNLGLRLRTEASQLQITLRCYNPLRYEISRETTVSIITKQMKYLRSQLLTNVAAQHVSCYYADKTPRQPKTEDFLLHQKNQGTAPCGTKLDLMAAAAEPTLPRVNRSDAISN
jgi:hypothetical protein